VRKYRRTFIFLENPDLGVKKKSRCLTVSAGHTPLRLFRW